MRKILNYDMPYLNSMVGFERLFNEIEQKLSNTEISNYPPYNVVQLNEDEWNITLAVAGFDMDDINITLDKNTLNIEGSSSTVEENVKYIHKGLASRNFKRKFTLAEHVEVKNATLNLGLLTIHLKREVPEDKMPRKITINKTKLLEQ
jgi:molecular chaperone IbpA